MGRPETDDIYLMLERTLGYPHIYELARSPRVSLSVRPLKDGIKPMFITHELSPLEMLSELGSGPIDFPLAA